MASAGALLEEGAGGGRSALNIEPSHQTSWHQPQNVSLGKMCRETPTGTLPLSLARYSPMPTISFAVARSPDASEPSAR